MRGRAFPYLLIAPAVIFLVVLFFVPLVQTIALAFQTSAGPGFGNFLRMEDDLNFRDAVVNTFRFVGLAVPLQLAAAMGMALMLRNLGRGRELVLWIWTIPLGLSDLAAGLVWLALLNDRGYIASLLFQLGLVSGPQSWLTYETPVALFVAVVIAEFWRATAIVVVILFAGLQLVPKEYAEAASVFGASRWKVFTKITLPLMKPSIQSALILRTVLAFEAFAVVIAIGGRNFPVLVSEAYTWQNFNQEPAVAAAYAVVVMGLSLAATVLWLWLLKTPAEQRT